MRTEDTTVPEAAAAVDAGYDEVREYERLEHFAEHTDDPALRRELEASAASGQVSARGFRKAWDRLWMAFQVGR